MIAAPPTLAKLKPNPHWARLPLFDRKGWRTMAFGEFAESVNVRVEPSTAAEAIYVGLDDLDSGSLQIRRWGKGSDVIGTKLRFRKGDIIFGRRRAYQRKLAVAKMDGICSAHAMVVRARPGVVLPEFLPFLMVSDRFMNRAVEISVGSLSPTINWTTFKHEPFALPPLNQQLRIAEILWAVDEVAQRHQVTSQQIEQLPLSFANHVTGAEGGRRAAIQTAALGEVADVIDCKHRTPKPCSEGVPIVSPGNIKWGALDLSDCKLTSEEQYQDLMDHCVVREWDMVMGRNQTFGIAAFVQRRQRFVLGQDTVLIQSRKLSSKYIYLALQSSLLRSQIDQLSIGSTFKRINLKDIRALRIPLANASMQREAEIRVDQYEQLKGDVKRNREAVTNLRSSILNVVMNGPRQSL
jgi:type I restriction enzyme, S subunit